jgi:maleate isomerase
MASDAWRGMVGIIKPTRGSASLVEMIRMLPDGIGIIPLFNNIRHGKIEEFRAALPAYEEKIAELAEDRVDLIHAAGTPPFMLLGYKGEQEIIDRWEKQFKIPIFTSGTNQIAALKALNIKKFVGVGYDFEDTSIVRNYFTAAGFDVLGIERLPVPTGSPNSSFAPGSRASLGDPEAAKRAATKRRLRPAFSANALEPAVRRVSLI